jgi:hypothetical protein
MKKINNWVIRTFGLRGSWSWAKKQMLNGAIIKRKATTGTYKKVHIINHRCGDDEIEVKNGIRVFDWVGNEFIINLNNFGELEINGLNEGLCIIPQYGNQIVIKKQI